MRVRCTILQSFLTFLASELSVTDLHGCASVRISRVSLAAVKDSCLKGSIFTDRQVIKLFITERKGHRTQVYTDILSHHSILCHIIVVLLQTTVEILSFLVGLIFLRLGYGVKICCSSSSAWSPVMA